MHTRMQSSAHISRLETTFEVTYGCVQREGSSGHGGGGGGMWDQASGMRLPQQWVPHSAFIKGIKLIHARTIVVQWICRARLNLCSSGSDSTFRGYN